MKTLVLCVGIVALLTIGGACGTSGDHTQSSEAEEAVAHRPIEDVLRDHTDTLMRIDGVVSVGQGLCDRTPCIRVGVRAITDSLRREIPDTLEGHPVDVHEVGTVRPLNDGS